MLSVQTIIGEVEFQEIDPQVNSQHDNFTVRNNQNLPENSSYVWNSVRLIYNPLRNPLIEFIQWIL